MCPFAPVCKNINNRVDDTSHPGICQVARIPLCLVCLHGGMLANPQHSEDCMGEERKLNETRSSGDSRYLHGSPSL